MQRNFHQVLDACPDTRYDIRVKQRKHETTMNKITKIECPRCDGKGWLPHFRHIKNGTCFMCAGSKLLDIRKPLKKRAETRPPIVKHEKETYPNGKTTETLSVYFDTPELNGYNIEFCRRICEETKESLRSLWVYMRDNGAIMETFNKK